MTLREIITKIGFNVDDASLKDAESKTKKMALGMKVAIGAAVAGLAAIGKSAVTSAADMEMLTTQFEVMLGSADKAALMMEDLKKFAASTPFALSDLSTGTQQLLSFGVASEDVVETMRMLGDTAGGDAEKLSGLVLAYGKVTTKGKASLEEINMMAERGIPIFDVLSQQMGTSKEELFKLISAGKVSAANIKQAFQTMTSEGGMFFEGMQKQSLTFQGMLSTLKDNITMTLAGIGEVMMAPLKDFMGQLTEMLQGELGEGLKQMLIPLFDIVLSLLPVIVDLLIPIMKIVGQVAAAVTPIIQKLSAIVLRLLPIALTIIQAIFPIVEAAFRIVDALFPILDTIVDILEAILPIVTMIIDLVVFLLPAVEAIVGVVVKIVNWVLQLVSSAEKLSFWFVYIAGPLGFILNLILSIREHWSHIMAAFTDGGFLKGIVAIGKAILDSLLSPIQGLLELISKIPGLGNLAEGLVDKVQGFRDKLFEQEQSLIDKRAEGDTIFNAAGSAMETPTAFPTPAGPNVNMDNNITVNVPEGTNTEAVKTAVADAARAAFSVELQRVLVDAEF